MSKKAHETALPKLRFPEFRDVEAWEVKPLGSVAKLIKEKAGSKQYKLMSITSGAGLVSQMEKFGREIAGASYKNYYVIRKGDFAYNKSSTKLDPEGQIALLENEEAGAVPNSIFTCFRVNEQIVSPHFLKYPFANNLHGRWLRDLITVGARVNGALSIDSKHLLALPLALPSLLEQQKIAAALSSLDDLLTAQTAKLTALQAHKRGLVQDLFPAEGESVPKLRFPEFQQAGVWKIKSLGEMFQLQRGFDLPHRLRQNGSVPIISSSGNSGYHNQALVEAPGVVTGRYGTIGEVFYVEENFWPLNTTLYVKDFKGNVPAFIAHFLKTIDFASYSEKSGVPGVNRNDLHQITVACPTTAEQEKIAVMLFSIDNLINAQSQKINILKLHKKGLMQALFPAASEQNV